MFKKKRLQLICSQQHWRRSISRTADACLGY